MSSSKTHDILILGSHFSGLGTAHSLLRDVLPALSAAAPSTAYHVTIVAPHTEYFYNIAAPRHLIGKDVVPSDKIFFPIAGALADYPADQVSFVQGKATAVDEKRNVVTVSLADGAPRELTYQTLVIATGTTSNSKLWQINDHESATKALYASIHASLPTAKTVLIAGGGAVGVETAGEIGYYHPTVKTTILSGNDRLLPRLVRKNSSAAEYRLKALGVDTVHNLRVTSSTQHEDGTTTVVLSNGTSRTVDLYIDATGGKPNSSFLPASWLNAKGYVLTDGKTLRTPVHGVYAIGDVADYSTGSLIEVVASILPLTSSIGIDLAAAAGTSAPAKQKPYSPLRNSQIVPTGPGTGVGQLMGWRVPGWFVWLVKARTFFVEKAEPSWKGKDVGKA